MEARTGSVGARQTRNASVSFEEEGHHFRIVTTDTAGVRDPEVDLLFHLALNVRCLCTSIVGVQVRQSWDDRLTGCIDDLSTGRHWSRLSRTSRLDAIVSNHDDRVGNRPATGAVNQLSSNYGDAAGLYRLDWIRTASRKGCDEEERDDSSER